MALAGLILFVLWMTIWVNVGEAFGNFLEKKFSKNPSTSGWYVFGMIITIVFAVGVVVEVILFLES